MDAAVKRLFARVEEMQREIDALKKPVTLLRADAVYPTPTYSILDVSIKAAMVTRIVLKSQPGKTFMRLDFLDAANTWMTKHRVNPHLHARILARLTDPLFLSKELGWRSNGFCIWEDR